MEKWFIPAPEDFPSQRALLHFGLNKAVRYYRELIVPGIGGVWFVRQISWAMAGIKLAEQLNYKPAKIANAIEALSGKLEWKNSEKYNGKGTRAFQRKPKDWKFKQLSTKQYYVQITYRMAAVRALTGLGLVTGTRFNSMELTQAGSELAKIFLNQKGCGKGGSILENMLKKWIQGNGISKSGNIVSCLCKTNALSDEKQIVLNRLMAEESGSSRRKELIAAFGHSTVNMPNLKIIKERLKQAYVNDITTAMAFDAILEGARELIYQQAEHINKNIKNSKSHPELKKKLNDFRGKMDLFSETTGQKHSDAENFVAEMKDIKNNTALLEKLVARDGNILMLSNNKIVKGLLFDHRKDIKHDSAETKNQNELEESSTINKINQLFILWRDCK